MEFNLNISIDINIDYFENKSGLSDNEIARQVYRHVLVERAALVTEAKTIAHEYLDGERTRLPK